jgi:hypothetical protein
VLTHRSPRRRPLLAAAAAVLLAAAAGLTIAGSILAGEVPPPPPTAGLGATPGPATSPAARPAVPAPLVPSGPQTLSYSVPVSVTVPAIGVRASIVALGENPDHTVQVPPLSEPQETSWFDLGPTPGQRGPAVLLGHVDTAATGPAVFYKLGDLRPGNTVMVTRADHQTAVFRIDRVEEYQKVSFPSLLVYGPTKNAQLRLVTCGGAFDPQTGHYLSNIVAYATLTSVITPSLPHRAHPRIAPCVPAGPGIVARLCT